MRPALLLPWILLAAGCVSDKTARAVFRWDASNNVEFPDSAQFESLETGPLIYNAGDRNPWLGIDCPPQMADLPPGCAYVGSEKKQFIIPITESPPPLEEGDVLIYNINTNAMPETFWDFYSTGKLHANIVLGDSANGFRHLDAPKGLSGTNFSKHPYYPAFHILRLRRLPNEITCRKELKRWKEDPEKRRKLDEFTAKRRATLDSVVKLAKCIENRDYRYDSARITEHKKLFGRLTIDQALARDSDLGSVHLNCSELVALLYEREGVRIPWNMAVYHSLFRINEEAERRLEEQPWSTRYETIRGILNSAFRQRRFFIDIGIEDDEMATWLTTGALPFEAQAVIGIYERHLLPDFPCNPESIVRDVESKSPLAALWDGIPTPVADLFEVIYHPDSPFVYIGTYVGSNGGGQHPTVTGKHASEEIDVRSNRNHLSSVYMHIFPIEKMAWSTDGTRIATSAKDETVKVFDLADGRTHTVLREECVTELWFPEGKNWPCWTTKSQSSATRSGEKDLVNVPKSVVEPANSNALEISGSLVTFTSSDPGGNLLMRHRHPVRGAMLTPDGRWIVTASGNSLHIFSTH